MYILLSTDAFQGTTDSLHGDVSLENKPGSGISNVRRPYRGIQIKDDTFAVLSVRMGGDNTPIPLVSSSDVQAGKEPTGYVNNYSDFILQRLEEQRMEKQQIIETFGDTFIYFFGERPRVITVSGMLMNTEDFNWRAQFWENYDKYLRGTKLVEMNARVCLAYDTIVLEGYILSAQAVDQADEPYSIPFQMSMVLTNYHDYSSIGSTDFPGVTATDYTTLNATLSEAESGFVSTGAQVRNMNLNASGPGGILNAIRQTMGTVNNIANGGLMNMIAPGVMQTISGIISGRAMRLPVGVAGFVAGLQNQAYLGAGSVLTSDMVRLDPRTGKLTTIGGVPVGYKLLMASTGQFAPSWISQVTGTSRGKIFENYDEYPMAPEKTLQQLLSPTQYMDYLRRGVSTASAAALDKFVLAQLALAQSAGSWVGDLASMVSLTRQGFGLYSTVGSMLSDPTALTTGLLGVTPNQLMSVATMGLLQINPITGQAYLGFAAGSTLKNISERVYSGDVLKLFSQQVLNQGPAQIGQNYKSTTAAETTAIEKAAAASDVTYKAAITEAVPAREADNTAVQEVYNKNSYRSNTTAAQSNNYEAAYGNSDYTALLAQQKSSDVAAAAAAAATTAGLTSGDAAAIQAAITSAYGDSDLQSRTDFINAGKTPEELVTLYGPSEQVIALIRASVSPALLSDADIKDIISRSRTTAALQSAVISALGSGVTPDSLDSVYSSVGTIKKLKLTPDQQAALLQLVYGTSVSNPESDVDVTGITGAEYYPPRPLDPTA